MLVMFLLCAAVLPQISESIFSPCLPDIAAAYAENMSSVEHVFTTYLVGYALGMLLWGSLSDYVGRIKALKFGLGIYLLGAIMCYQAASLNILLFARFIQGLGGSACAVIVIALCRDYFEEGKRAKMMAKLGMALSIGPMLGPVMGSSILTYFSWYHVYIPLIVYAVWLFFSTGYLPGQSKPDRVPNMRHYIEILQNKHLWLYAFLIGHSCGIGFSFFSEAPSFFMLSLGFPKQYFFLCFIIVSWAWYFGGKLSENMLAKHSIDQVMWVGVRFAFSAAVLFCCLVAVFQSQWVLIMGSLLCIFSIMLGLGLVIGNAITLALEPFSEHSGVAASVLGFLYYGVIALVAAGMAELHDGSLYVMPFYWLYVLTVCGLIVYKVTLDRSVNQALVS